MTTYTFEPIGTIHSCFKEKFGTPRQPGLVNEAEAQLEIFPPFRQKEAFRCLESFSHIWILFVFHHCIQSGWKATVRPPRLGGNQRVGVFASRSGFRPNPIGQSVVALSSVALDKGQFHLHIKGIDLIDGTPVLDIKPYLSYADSLPQAQCGYACKPPMPAGTVVFSEDAARSCRALEGGAYPQLTDLITKLLALDPRPGYQKATGKRVYGLSLWDLNVRFRVAENRVMVESVGR